MTVPTADVRKYLEDNESHLQTFTPVVVAYPLASSSPAVSPLLKEEVSSHAVHETDFEVTDYAEKKTWQMTGSAFSRNFIDIGSLGFGLPAPKRNLTADEQALIDPVKKGGLFHQGAVNKRAPHDGAVVPSQANPAESRFMTNYQLAVQFANVSGYHTEALPVLAAYRDRENSDVPVAIKGFIIPGDDSFPDSTLVYKSDAAPKGYGAISLQSPNTAFRLVSPTTSPTPLYHQTLHMLKLMGKIAP